LAATHVAGLINRLVHEGGRPGSWYPCRFRTKTQMMLEVTAAARWRRHRLRR
jgi:hypothetical protein